MLRADKFFGNVFAIDHPGSQSMEKLMRVADHLEQIGKTGVSGVRIMDYINEK